MVMKGLLAAAADHIITMDTKTFYCVLTLSRSLIIFYFREEHVSITVFHNLLYEKQKTMLELLQNLIEKLSKKNNNKKKETLIPLS